MYVAVKKDLPFVVYNDFQFYPTLRDLQINMGQMGFPLEVNGGDVYDPSWTYIISECPDDQDFALDYDGDSIDVLFGDMDLDVILLSRTITRYTFHGFTTIGLERGSDFIRVKLEKRLALVEHKYFLHSNKTLEEVYGISM